MRAVTIHYEKTFNLGNYQSEKVGIFIDVETNNEAQDAIEVAKQFVERNRTNAQQSS